MEDMNCSLEGFHDFVIVSSKFGEGMSLLLEDVHDIIDSIAVFELPSERMVDQFCPCLFFIAFQGSVKQRVEPRARGVSHYASGRTVYRAVGSKLCGAGPRIRPGGHSHHISRDWLLELLWKMLTKGREIRV
jgi:hypothetical protein